MLTLSRCTINPNVYGIASFFSSLNTAGNATANCPSSVRFADGASGTIETCGTCVTFCAAHLGKIYVRTCQVPLLKYVEAAIPLFILVQSAMHK